MPHLPATAARAPAAPRGRPWRRSRSSAARGGAAPAPISASDAPARSISVAAVCRSRCAPTGGNPARAHAPRTTCADAALGGSAPARRDAPAGTPPGPSARRPALQIADDRLADIDRQRQPLVPAALAADDELAGAPVDVVELRARRPRRRAAPAAPATAGSRSRAGRPSAADRSWPAAAPTAAGSSPRGSERSRRSATAGTAHSKRRRDQPRQMQVAQQRAQPATPAPSRRPRCASGTRAPRTCSRPRRSTAQARARRAPALAPGTAARPAHNGPAPCARSARARRSR